MAFLHFSADVDNEIQSGEIGKRVFASSSTSYWVLAHRVDARDRTTGLPKSHCLSGDTLLLGCRNHI
jgi:hypothetical protein